MLAIFEFTTEYFDLEKPDNLEEQSDLNEKSQFQSGFFIQVDPVNDVITASVIFCVGLILNVLILRCYWSIKTPMAVYIRVLAVYDIFLLLNMMTTRILIAIFPAQSDEVELFRLLIGHLFFFLHGSRSHPGCHVSSQLQKAREKDANR